MKLLGEINHRQLNQETQLRESLTSASAKLTSDKSCLGINFTKSDLISSYSIENELNNNILSLRYVSASFKNDFGLKNNFTLNTALFSTVATASGEDFKLKNLYRGGSVLIGKKYGNYGFSFGVTYDSYLGKPQFLPAFSAFYKYRNIFEVQLNPRLADFKYKLSSNYNVSIGLDNKSRYARLGLTRSERHISEVEHLDFSLVTGFEYKSTQNWNARFGMGYGIYQKYVTKNSTLNYSNGYSVSISINHQF